MASWIAKILGLPTHTVLYSSYVKLQLNTPLTSKIQKVSLLSAGIEQPMARIKYKKEINKSNK
jgi:hypothetical protein